ncbi:MAG: PTS glucose transporter subunit IIA [Quinella sp. 3Q1]|nr:PTS glucose transporter subunit IIA [Quinella sp. 3Q1]
MIPLNECPDPVFSSGAMGRGVAIKNPDYKVYAPFDGEVAVLFPTNHAIGLESNDGIELFIHVGMDTVKMNGESFKAYVESGEVVKRGQLLLEFSPTAIKMAGHDTTTPVVVINHADFGDITFELNEQSLTVTEADDSTQKNNSSQEEDGMEDAGRKFTILGETGSGKTCYLLGMYYEMSMSVANYTVVATDPDADKNLTLRYKMLLDKARGRGRFPAGTEQMEKYNFNLQYNYETIHPFQWVDYPGGFLDTTRRDESSKEYQEVAKSILESEMLFICIDGANLKGGNTSQKIRKVKTRCAHHINPYLTDLCNKLKAEKQGLPPIGMLITKYDMCAADTDADEVREIVEEAFEGLFGGNDTFVAIIPVSLGDTLEDDEYQGELEPLNVHLPILMGINFALIDQLQYGKRLIENQRNYANQVRALKREEEDRFFLSRWLFGGYDTDKLQEEIDDTEEAIRNNRQVAGFFKKSLKRMNRELEAIDMIYVKGAWQDKRGIQQMWAELQSIADYNF